jgi:hypothetical protein
MHGLRLWMRRHEALVLLCAALVLCLKLAVPAGYMIDGAGPQLRLILCTTAADGSTIARAVDVPGGGHGPGGEPQADDAPCAYSVLSMGALDAAAAFVVAALVFVFMRALWAAMPPPTPLRLWLLPPLRGPPFHL